MTSIFGNVTWTPQFVVALAVAVMLSNVLAIVVHSATWWLRKRVIVVPTLLGIVALLLSIAFINFVIGLSSCSNWPEPSPAGCHIKAQKTSTLWTIIFCAFIGLMGAVQMRQIPAKWFAAAMCFTFELTLSCCLWAWLNNIYTYWKRSNSSPYNTYLLFNSFIFVFGLSLLLMALFRPMFLNVLKYMRGSFSRNRGNELAEI